MSSFLEDTLTFIEITACKLTPVRINCMAQKPIVSLHATRKQGKYQERRTNCKTEKSTVVPFARSSRI